MPHRLRPVITRPSSLLLAALLPASLALTACGSDDESLPGLDAVEISGEVGTAPELDWKGVMEPGKAEVTVITEGTGEEIAKDDVVLVEFTLANGYTHQINYDTYDEFTLPAMVTVGVQKDPEGVTDLLTGAVKSEIEPGQKLGTRFAVTVGSEELLGDYLGNPQVAQFFAGIDVGNEDGLLFVADLIGIAGKTGEAQEPPAWTPALVETDGAPTGFDFKGIEKPKKSDKLGVAVLTNGSGPVVEPGQKILVNYLGQVYDGKTPFDESYTGGSGLEAVVGGPKANVVKGWSRGLVGQPVGSRVVLRIPPKLGYGKEGSGESIPGGATLYFVVDILGVANVKPEVEPVPEPTPPAAPTDPAAVPSDPAASTPPSEGASE